jgi:hypothetical protein
VSQVIAFFILDTHIASPQIGTGFSDEALESLAKGLQSHVIETPPKYYQFSDVCFLPALPLAR